MCEIGRVKRIIRNEAKPQTAAEVMLTAVPIKLRELIYVRRVQRMEDKKNKQ